MRTLKPIAAALAVIALSACGSASVEANASYESVTDLRDAYGSAVDSDEECDEEVTQDALEQWGWQSINCGTRTSLVVYETNAALEQSFWDGSNGPSAGASDEGFIVGPNWHIKTPYWNAETVQEALGGELHRGER